MSGPSLQRGEAVKPDRATTKVLALASTLSVTMGLALGSGLGAGTAMAAAGNSSSSDSGARQQAIVSLAGSSAVTVPGVKVESLLSAVHVEVVDGTQAQLDALATMPGVLGIEANAAAHLEDSSWGGAGLGDLLGALFGRSGSGHRNGNGNGNGNQPPPATTPAPTPTDNGVLAATSLGGQAGRGNAGNGVTVALIDTGVSDTDALNRASGSLVDAVDTSGLNTDTGTIVEHGTFADGYGHGTFMASIIAGGKVAGSGQVAIGVVPGATVDVVKVADDQGNTSLGAVLAGLNWVATHSDTVDVANLSLSVDRPSSSYGIDPLNMAVTLTRDSGVTVVVASGNTAGVVGDPGFDPASLTVGAADTTATTPTVASFSGYDNVDGVTKPDVVAAGVNVLGEMPTDSVIGQQFPDARQPSGLFRGSGTSQSTAIVSGLAALYLQSHKWASPLQVKAAIRGAASSIASDSTDGQGLVGVPTGAAYNPLNTGELSLNVDQWYATASQWGDLFTSGVFDTRRWSVRRWSADGWDSRRWSDVSFDSRRWSNRRWSADTWDCRRWSAAFWGDAR